MMAVENCVSCFLWPSPSDVPNTATPVKHTTVGSTHNSSTHTVLDNNCDTTTAKTVWQVSITVSFPLGYFLHQVIGQ
jgi:hypothetical protein